MKNLRNVIVLITISLFSINSFAQSDVVGEWVLGEQNSVVKIEQQDGFYCGEIMSSDNPKAEIGKLMVKELKQTKDTWKGKVYSPKRKKWYDAEFVPKENLLEVKIKVGFFSKTMEWKRK
ncbi:hypothetical protein LPB136_03500 [Tenacibaculum todarodis]|uniref:DUF2147 domain-containing protein n=1 Tax=Tenacibaculum todarodis TaxID=1850252 RepID=A0A1L3JHA2_9FLAO|nr:DUF2147 domain-containing protein [Tenacibaculum todarodis]APG64484.1 hypothetical protein LPB136_03500 [Tenacibaculum todarodis]